MGNIDAAIDLMQEWADSPISNALEMLADLLVRRGDVEDAIGILRDAAEADTTGLAGFYLIKTLLRLGRIEDVRKYAEEGSHAASDMLAEHLEQWGYATEALDVLHAAARAGSWLAAQKLAKRVVIWPDCTTWQRRETNRLRSAWHTA